MSYSWASPDNILRESQSATPNPRVMNALPPASSSIPVSNIRPLNNQRSQTTSSKPQPNNRPQLRAQHGPTPTMSMQDILMMVNSVKDALAGFGRGVASGGEDLGRSAVRGLSAWNPNDFGGNSPLHDWAYSSPDETTASRINSFIGEQLGEAPYYLMGGALLGKAMPLLTKAAPKASSVADDLAKMLKTKIPKSNPMPPVNEALRIKESTGAVTLEPTFEVYLKNQRAWIEPLYGNLDRNGLIKILKEEKLPSTAAEFIKNRNKSISRYIEEPIQWLVKKILNNGGTPRSSNYHGQLFDPSAPSSKYVQWTDETGRKIVTYWLDNGELIHKAGWPYH